MEDSKRVEERLGEANPFARVVVPEAHAVCEVIVKRALSTHAIVRLSSNSPPLDVSPASAASSSLFDKALSFKKTMNDSYIVQDHLLTLFEDPGVKVIIEEANLIEANLKAAVSQFRGNRRTDLANSN